MALLRLLNLYFLCLEGGHRHMTYVYIFCICNSDGMGFHLPTAVHIEWHVLVFRILLATRIPPKVDDRLPCKLGIWEAGRAESVAVRPLPQLSAVYPPR